MVHTGPSPDRVSRTPGPRRVSGGLGATENSDGCLRMPTIRSATGERSADSRRRCARSSGSSLARSAHDGRSGPCGKPPRDRGAPMLGGALRAPDGSTAVFVVETKRALLALQLDQVLAQLTELDGLPLVTAPYLSPTLRASSGCYPPARIPTMSPGQGRARWRGGLPGPSVAGPRTPHGSGCRRCPGSHRPADPRRGRLRRRPLRRHDRWWERAHAACVAAGDPVAAGSAAVRIAMHLLFDTALMAPVRGWFARRAVARGPREDAGPRVVRDLRNYERMLAGDLVGAREWARRAVEIGATYDAAACAIRRVAEARLLILDGDVRPSPCVHVARSRRRSIRVGDAQLLACQGGHRRSRRISSARSGQSARCCGAWMILPSWSSTTTSPPSSSLECPSHGTSTRSPIVLSSASSPRSSTPSRARPIRSASSRTRMARTQSGASTVAAMTSPCSIRVSARCS
ncbi:hypothetical protein BH20ACT2_BH20ACT2_07230 [soil metagenome]